MRTTELIRMMPTQFRRTTENPLYSGHFIPLLGYWTEDEGWVKKQDLEFESETLSCPIIAVVETKIGNKDLALTITGKQSEYDNTTERTEGDYTLKRKTYKDASTTIEVELIVPRFTRPYGTFLITGLGNNIWGISDITTEVENCAGKINFYALASNGSRIIYWMGIHFLAEELREILRPWIAPPKCSRCSGTGLEPDAEDTACKQCFGYKYSGYSAIKKGQRNLGFDVGLARDILDWDNLTDNDHDLIKKFINKCWTQKWWVTPTLSEVKRIFSHFFDVPVDNIRVVERYNEQEPVWQIFLPNVASIASPFGEGGILTSSDTELMKYIARSITPAGVSVFVGFYTDLYIGDLIGFDDSLYIKPFEMPYSSLYPEYELHGIPRIDFYNGWTLATDNFERETSLGWETNGTVEIVNVNDMNRHMAMLSGDSYMQSGISNSNGTIELWVHPDDNMLRVGTIDGSSQWMWYVEFDTNGFYDNDGYLITMAKSHNDYHLSIDYNDTSQQYDVRIMKETVATGISYLNPGPVSKFRIQNYVTGESYIDAVGVTEDSNYNLNDNWQRLHEYGLGINNEYFATGVSGDQFDVKLMYRNDRFINLNDY